MGLRGWMWAVLAAALMMAVPAQAQWAIYAAGTGVELKFPDTGRLYGGTAGFYKAHHHALFSVGPDFRMTITQRGNVSGLYTDERLDTGLGGVRLAVTPHVLPIMPYVEGLIGEGYWRGGIGLTRQDKHGFTAQGVVGVDWTVLPRIDWRVAEFTYGRMTGIGDTINPRTLSTGFVIRLP